MIKTLFGWYLCIWVEFGWYLCVIWGVFVYGWYDFALFGYNVVHLFPCVKYPPLIHRHSIKDRGGSILWFARLSRLILSPILRLIVNKIDGNIFNQIFPIDCFRKSKNGGKISWKNFANPIKWTTYISHSLHNNLYLISRSNCGSFTGSLLAWL